MPGDGFGPYRQPLEAALRAALPQDDSPVSAACRYVMGWEDERGEPSNAGGKRLRPLVTCQIATLLGASLDRVLPGAVAIELVHNFSLVHDEIQDQDATRHGRPTLWSRLGTAQAINAGDLLFTRAFAALRGGEDAAIQSSFARVLTGATEAMIRGQWQDLEFESRSDVTADEYLAMVAGKTGALIGACGEIAALAASRDDAIVDAFARWGVTIGLAFQAQDDYLGVWGDSEETGKSNTNDIARHKKSLPVLLGLADDASQQAIRTTYSQPETGAEAVRNVVQALERAGVHDQTLSMARRFQDEAEELVQMLPDTAAKQGLLAMGRLLVERDR